ncbi:glycosyltransferase family 2 protein [Candidatus Saccharibacteria bacterium TM7i]|nr:glycosyltransferase family 2 protein [Candidatus Saccharibacteria bacterium TM7i]
MSVVALIPAHNEPSIGLTVDSILRQSHPVDAVIVITNNCTDNGRTARRARAHGATVIDLGVIEGKKAGALNTGFEIVRQEFPDANFLLQMDADTILDEHFVENTVAAMRANDRIAGLGASFIAQNKPGEGAVGKFLVWGQRQEFARFHGGQLTKQTSVLSGTATLLRVDAILELRNDRGFIWSETCIVEDYETTKALQSRQWLCMTDTTFIAHTDVMTNWKDLLQQRKRWQRGTLEVIFREYRGQECTRLDKLRQYFAHIMIAPHLLSYLALIILAFMWGGLEPLPLIVVWFVMGTYNAWSARRAGWKSALFAGTLIPVELYNFVRYYWLWKSWRLYRTAQAQAW